MLGIVERFITPRTVVRFYDEPLVRSPWFWLLTGLFALLGWRTIELFHKLELALVFVSLTSVWVHLIVQHSWFRSDDVQTLKRNASRTTLIFCVLYLITVSIMLIK
jgi:hypothetical protein